MAVTLSSDLIADVMRIADPSRLRTASAKLGGVAGAGADFAGMIGEAAASGRVRDRGDDLLADVLGAADDAKRSMAEAQLGGVPQAVAAAAPGNEPYKAFEQMVLRNMFETMMPQADSGAYGTDSSAGIWRSLANDQLANVYADWGGLGIARTLAEPQSGGKVTTDGHWPYFETRQIRSFVG